MRIIWAIRSKYLSSKDNKWHYHTTKWYEESDKAWEEIENFQLAHPEILEMANSLIHKCA